MEQLLLRKSIYLDAGNIKNYISGKKVMITGAAGSIGHELLKQTLDYQPELVVAIDQSESGIASLTSQFPQENLHLKLGDITDAEGMKRLFSEFRPDLLFHAAAYKHVVLLESQPVMAIKNNIFGTCILAELAIEFGVEKFVFISTDKAVNPCSVMGITKRICELYLIALKTSTDFVITRFGNVLGSQGSVYPIILDRILRHKPIEITHPEATRYFITIPESAMLALEAAAIGKAGQIMIFEMGYPLSIIELATRLINKYKLPGQHCDIVFTGLKPGEKLHEDLQYPHEKLVGVHQEQIRIIGSEDSGESYIQTEIENLRQLIYTATSDDLRLALKNSLR
ncbi:MAG TPA: polysaccharide biosynthesis protein [Dyadobacter sp.]|jgi:FlaA1/EpsC-like NDP-sugar epimerase|nr:polysaccharide biosynthesis protein [Dyadobacter sp.]